MLAYKINERLCRSIKHLMDLIENENEIPEDLVCPITREIFFIPIQSPCDERHVFERHALVMSMKINSVCPLCRININCFGLVEPEHVINNINIFLNSQSVEFKSRYLKRKCEILLTNHITFFKQWEYCFELLDVCLKCRNLNLVLECLDNINERDKQFVYNCPEFLNRLIFSCDGLIKRIHQNKGKITKHLIYLCVRCNNKNDLKYLFKIGLIPNVNIDIDDIYSIKI